MVKDGSKDVTLAYLAAAPRNRLALNGFTDGTHSVKHGPPSREWQPGTLRESMRNSSIAFDAALARRDSADWSDAVQTQGQNIRRYSEYLLARTLAYADTKVDYCKIAAIERMKSLPVDKGLLRETGAIQDQIRALLKCDVGIPFLRRRDKTDCQSSSPKSPRTISRSWPSVSSFKICSTYMRQ